MHHRIRDPLVFERKGTVGAVCPLQLIRRLRDSRRAERPDQGKDKTTVKLYVLRHRNLHQAGRSTETYHPAPGTRWNQQRRCIQDVPEVGDDSETALCRPRGLLPDHQTNPGVAHSSRLWLEWGTSQPFHNFSGAHRGKTQPSPTKAKEPNSYLFGSSNNSYQRNKLNTYFARADSSAGLATAEGLSG